MPIISGGGGSPTPPVEFDGSNPATVPLTVVAAPGQTSDIVSFVDNDTSGVRMQVPGPFRIEGGDSWDANGGPFFQVNTKAATPHSDTWLANFLGTAGNLIFKQSGHAYINAHTAPADADLSAGECAFWFDQTNGVGNTKMMFKGKSADGTVKTAAIVLA